MPTAAPRYCQGDQTCPNPGTYKGRCLEHARVQERTRYNAATRKWYSSQAWQAARLMALAKHPVCVACHYAPSVMADHKVPHRGDWTLFWDPANHQGMCRTCHGRKTARGE